MAGQVVGYVRVSSAQQNEARQVEAIGAVDRTFTDRVSGKNREDRNGLAEMIAYVRDGDTIRVKSIDRLARSTVDLLNIVKELRAKGVAVEFVDTPDMNVNSAQGEFMVTVMAAFATLERETIRERQAEGIAIAKAAGKYERAPKLGADQIAQARQWIADGIAKAEAARRLGVSRQTLYTALKA